MAPQGSSELSFARYYRRAFPFGFPLGVAITAYGLSPNESTLGFYGLAAQVIPVLLLVLAVEARVADLRPLRSAVEGRTTEGAVVFYRIVLGAGLVAYLAVGELCALSPVVQDEAASGNAKVVMSAMAAGLAAIGVIALLGWTTALETARAQQTTSSTAFDTSATPSSDRPSGQVE